MHALLAATLLQACGGDDGSGPGGDAGTDSGPAPPTIAEICVTRDGCVDDGDPHAGICSDVLADLEAATREGCTQCLNCLASAICDEWAESPNGPIGCDDSCLVCETGYVGEQAQFRDPCTADAECAYGHWCDDAGLCQRACDANAQCDLAVCGEDGLCWLACGDTRCPDPEAECTETIRDTRGNVVSVCAGGE